MVINRVNAQSHIYISKQHGIKTIVTLWPFVITLQGRHNERHGVSNHRRLDCLLNRMCRSRSKGTPKLRSTGFCEGNSPLTGEFPTQRASNAEKVSIWWRHHTCYAVIVSCIVGVELWRAVAAQYFHRLNRWREEEYTRGRSIERMTLFCGSFFIFIRNSLDFADALSSHRTWSISMRCHITW